MATRFYLHNAVAALGGTLPSAVQGSYTKSTVAAGTLRTMNGTIGTAQAATAWTTNATTSAQTALLGWFVSVPLAAQTITANPTVSVNYANAETNLSANIGITVGLRYYFWRPTTGALVPGTSVINVTGTGTEPGGASSERVNQATLSPTQASITLLDGDLLVFELYNSSTQAAATAYTGTFYFDGTTTNTTTNANVSNHASYIEFNNTITALTSFTSTASVTLKKHTTVINSKLGSILSDGGFSMFGYGGARRDFADFLILDENGIDYLVDEDGATYIVDEYAF